MSQLRSDRMARSDAVDFFRGLALLIIFVNHIPFNEVGLYTPSRFGFSDGAEIFVYCSGLVSALAFGRYFQHAGVWLGSVRVLHRCGRIYVAHLSLFITLAILCALGNALFPHPDYIDRLNIRYFFDQTPEALLGLASLTYVPNYFDILPMYCIILLWVPVVWAVAQIQRGSGLLLPILTYAAMWFWGWELPADPHTGRSWFFNPFAWQLLFFIGFACGSGWLRIAPGRAGLMRFCWAVVLLAIPLAYEPIFSRVEWLGYLRAGLEPLMDKTHFGLLRGLHFLALAYLAYSWCCRHPGFLKRPFAARVRKAGEHSLTVFFLGMSLSYIGGMVLDQLGHGAGVLALVNAGGCVLLVAAAHGVAWLDTKPWKVEGRSAAALEWKRRAGMAQSVVLRWQTQVLRSLPTSALLLTLSVAPLYLVNKQAMLRNASLQMSDSTGVLDEPGTLLPSDIDTGPPEEEQGPDQEEPPASLETTTS